MLLKKDTYQQQSDLAQYCRSGILTDELKVRKDRVHHYHRLFKNVIDDNLRSAFPLTVNLLNKNEWDELVSFFFSQHASRSAQSWQIPKEFFQFVKNNHFDVKDKYPHLDDLLYFEWLEIEVFMMENIPYPSFTRRGNWIIDSIKLNPEHKIVRVSYPVHLKKATEISKEDQGDFYIVLFREQDIGKVQFLDISAFFVVILENIKKGIILRDILKALKNELQMDSMEHLLMNTIPFLNKIRIKGLALGFEKK